VFARFTNECAGRLRLRLFAAFVGLTMLFAVDPAVALEPIVLTPDIQRVEITKFSEHYKERGDTLQVETASDAGISNRMAVKAQTPGTDPKWIVFALKNPTDKQIVRLVSTKRYNIIGSGILRPDLDAQRLVHLTPSVGFLPTKVPDEAVDVYRITLEPGATVTFVAELSNARFPRVFLWDPLALTKKVRDITLFNGIMLGIVGILAIFLTAIFVANHKSIFPATAFIAWCVGAYLCVDFGFWNKLFRLSADHNATYRAATEAAIAASLVIFLYTFLRIRYWHGWIKILFGVWVLAQLGLIGLAIIDPVLVSGFARLSLLFIGGMGALLIGYLAVRGQDRALALVPTWLLFLVWLFGAGVAAIGQLSGDIVSPALTSGLVLILVLLGFTVTQFAFRSFEPLAGAPPSQLQLRSLALEGAGASVWQWNSRRDEISVSSEIEDALGLHEGELTCRVEQWMQYLHPSDRERFRLLMRSLHEKNGGEMQLEFRMRGHEGHFLWYELRAHSVMMPHHRSLRCVGLMRDISGAKHSQERLLSDAVHDNLTGLPNRELFLDRLQISIARVKDEGNVSPPTVLFVDIDRFKHVNQSFGMVIGDTMLLTIARRLQRHLGLQDSLARLNADQFAVLLVTENNPQEIALLAERMRRSLRSPMKIGGKEIILTGSIGIAVFDGTQLSHEDLLNEAELAMYRAKRSGTDRIEIFKPTMRGERDNRLALESDLRRAIERRQIKILYQPITKLKGEDLTGFEALIRWDHPKHGRLSPDEFIPIAEESDLISELGSYVLNQAVKDAVQWNRILVRPDEPLVVSVNISSRELFRQELYQEVRMILAREQLPENALRLEVTESLVMENPEVAVEILGWLRNAGAGLALDDFGTGYSNLSYLHRFPFDTLKVDRTIVHNVTFDKTGPAILRSVVALASELDLDVVAEGVESIEDVNFLRSIGCGFAQGFYFGEPMNQKDVIYLLEALSKTVKEKGRTGLFGVIRSKTGAASGEPGLLEDETENPYQDHQSHLEGEPDVEQKDSVPFRQDPIVEGPVAQDSVLQERVLQDRVVQERALQDREAQDLVAQAYASQEPERDEKASQDFVLKDQVPFSPEAQRSSVEQSAQFQKSVREPVPQKTNGNGQDRDAVFAGGEMKQPVAHEKGGNGQYLSPKENLSPQAQAITARDKPSYGDKSFAPDRGLRPKIDRAPNGDAEIDRDMILSDMDQKLQGLNEALDLAEKTALAGQSAEHNRNNGHGGDPNGPDLKASIDDRLLGMKSSLSSTDVYQQLASGAGYSDLPNDQPFDVGRPDGSRPDDGGPKRKFGMDANQLNNGAVDSKQVSQDPRHHMKPNFERDVQEGKTAAGADPKNLKKPPAKKRLKKKPLKTKR